MSPDKIAKLVSEAINLDQEIRLKEAKLKALKKLLIAEAESLSDEQVETEGGGSSIVFAGEDGCVARITFPAKKLKEAITLGSKTFLQVERLIGGKTFHDLFNREIYFVPVENFREEIEKKVETPTARRVIRLCESDSSPRVSFETKESA